MWINIYIHIDYSYIIVNCKLHYSKLYYLPTFNFCACNVKGFLREYIYEPLEEMYDVQGIFGVFCVVVCIYKVQGRRTKDLPTVARDMYS